MPRCLNCGNSTHFSCNKVPKSQPWNNGPNSGLVALFDEGSLISLENQGASYEDLTGAWSSPHLYFNSCNSCGSDKIVWP